MYKNDAERNMQDAVALQNEVTELKDKLHRRNMQIKDLKTQINLSYKGASVYARDLAKDKQTDSFMGHGFEAMLEEADKKNLDVLVGHYLRNPLIED